MSKPQSSERRDLGELLADSEGMTRALQLGVRDALRAHKNAGVPIVAFREGKIVLIPASDFDLDDPDTWALSPPASSR